MDQTLPLPLPLPCIFYYLLLNLLLLGFIAAEPNGLTIKLIHRDSPESPYYSDSLTFEERIERDIRQSYARAQYLSTIVSTMDAKTNGSPSMQPKMIRPIIKSQLVALFTVQVGIGSFDTTAPAQSFKTYTLHVDTGSDLTWVQCEDCHKPGRNCFHTIEPPFPNSVSKTYRPLPCKRHRLCLYNECIGDSCSYTENYLDGAFTTGILAQETLTFTSSTGHPEVIQNIVFGCDIDSRNMKYGDDTNNEVSGIFGLSRGPLSFLEQTESLTHRKFSYCLSNHHGRHSTSYLRFGADIARLENLRTTKFLLFERSPAFYLSLKGISVNGVRVNISESVFVRNRDGTGGCIIDSGTSYTSIIRPAFNTLIHTLLGYFSNFHNLMRSSAFVGIWELCYELLDLEAQNNFPSITFHLRGTDIDIDPVQAFLGYHQQGKRILCLAMLPQDKVTIIGAFQQVDHRFIYDTRLNQLQFKREACSANA